MARSKQTEQKSEAFQVRLPDDRRRALGTEADVRDKSPSEVIRLHLERYAEIVWRDLPKLSDHAWCAVFEAVGTVPTDLTGITWIGMSVARAFESPELGQKWKVNASELADAARSWTFGEACAVADAAVRFHSALADTGNDAIAAARRATTRPAAIVLEAPQLGERASPRSTRRKS